MIGFGEQYQRLLVEKLQEHAQTPRVKPIKAKRQPKKPIGSVTLGSYKYRSSKR